MLFVLEMTKGFGLDADGLFALLGRWAAFRSRMLQFVDAYDVMLSRSPRRRRRCTAASPATSRSSRTCRGRT
jgi:hypothetical protein